jgi:DNA-binding transcriptional ArsR family regulator
VRVERNRLNAVGDLVLREAEEMRALADPLRLRLFDVVRREGPATTAALAEQVGEDAPTTERHLGELESLGFIELDEGRWSTPARGIYFEIPEHGEDEQRAARTLSSVMLAAAAELPARWVSDAEPSLSNDWALAAGLFNARVELTPDELREIQEGMERLLEPFTTREPGDRPPAAAPVRVLAFFLPELSRR